MNALEGVIDDFNTSVFALIEEETKTCNEFWQKISRYIKGIGLAVEIYKKTGVAPTCTSENWETFEVLENRNSSKTINQRNSLKENVQPDADVSNEFSSIRNRPRRNAFKEATENINKLSNISLTTKLRRPDAVDDFQNIWIKKEKKSVSKCETACSDTSVIKVKTEIEQMPAPTQPAPRRKKQKRTESKLQVKTEKIEEDLSKEIATVNLVCDTTDKSFKIEDSVDDVSAKAKEKLGKRTRTPSPADEDLQKTEKRTKSRSDCGKHEDLATETNNEVARSAIADNTVVISKSPDNTDLETMNATVVVENPKYVNNVKTPVTNDTLTQESKENKQKALNKTVTKPSKQLFSPFEPSPVKKRIQAFENLRQESSGTPGRARTRAHAKEQETSQPIKINSNVKEKVKMFTPKKSKFSSSASTLKTNRLLSNDSVVSKSSSKASQDAYRRREEERREKNQEILKKREALMQAQEEKRRKREEKQLKAQQQRQALEKEKLKILEMQRLKDEKHKQLVAAQEQKKQKQKEELEKKRMMVKMRAIEEKRKEELQRLEEQRKAEEMSAKVAKKDEEMTKLVQKQKIQREQQQLPIYLRTKAPVLPTDDCYDSDDEEFKPTHFREPTWSTGNRLRDIQFVVITAGEAIKNSFFSRQAQTPDLQDIFEVIHPEKLKRSSSAMWHKPPRYTMMPVLDGHLEDDEVEED